MLPATRQQWLRTFCGNQRDRRAVLARWEDAADARDRYSGNSTRHFHSGGGSEEQFVILASVQGLVKSCGRVEGKGSSIHFGSDARLRADVGQIGRQAVAQIDRGRRQA